MSVRFHVNLTSFIVLDGRGRELSKIDIFELLWLPDSENHFSGSLGVTQNSDFVVQSSERFEICREPPSLGGIGFVVQSD